MTTADRGPALVHVRLTVNGRPVERELSPRRSLAEFLREDLALTGTHVGCEHGVCGACTVFVDGRTARSCLFFAAQLEGASVTTIEGLTPADGLSPLQAAFHECHALQCGFCTPGMIVTAHELLAETGAPTREEIREAIGGNLCMCTGYVNIVRAIEQAAPRLRAEPVAGTGEGTAGVPPQIDPVGGPGAGGAEGGVAPLAQHTAVAPLRPDPVGGPGGGAALAPPQNK